MHNESIALYPDCLLDDDWNFLKYLPLKAASSPFTEKMEEIEWLQWLHSIRIEISTNAITTEFDTDEESRYLKTEVGLNILVPKGHIKELRIRLVLIPKKRVVAVDGFPNNLPKNTPLIHGKIRLAINNSFKFIPVIGPILSELVDIKIAPWEFSLGNFEKVKSMFCGALTSTPEWYFRDDSIKGDLKLALTLRVPIHIDELQASIRGAWIFDPGFFQKARVGSDERTILIYRKINK